MRCPFCDYEDSQVKDSRPSELGDMIKRRRFCPSCGGRFTTFERIETKEIFVRKKSGARRPFDASKLAKSINIAARKRPVTDEQISEIVSKIIKSIQTREEGDIPTQIIGDLVIEELAQVDEVAYVRYVSVYKDFNKVNDFRKVITNLK